MEPFTPIVITSSRAKKDLADIKVKHSNLLNDIQNQSIKIKAYNDQKTLEQQQKLAIQSEQDKQLREHTLSMEKIKSDSQKSAMEMNIKSKELAIKQAALSQP